MTLVLRIWFGPVDVRLVFSFACYVVLGYFVGLLVGFCGFCIRGLALFALRSVILLLWSFCLAGWLGRLCWLLVFVC